MYKLFLCLRYLRKRRMVFFAIAAVTLCVAMVLIVISVMGGFLDMVRDRSRGLLGDVIIDGPLQGFPYYEEFIAELKREMPDTILEATPAILTAGLMRIPDPAAVMGSPDNYDMTKMVQLVGVRLDEAKRATAFGESLYYDKYYPGSTRFEPQPQPVRTEDEHGNHRLPDDYEAAFQQFLAERADSSERAKWLPRDGQPARRPGVFLYHPLEPGYVENDNPQDGVIIGLDVIAVRNEDASYYRLFPRGHRVILSTFPLTRKGGVSSFATPRRILAHYVDDSRTGVYEIDSTCVYLDFGLLQRNLDMDAQKLEDRFVTSSPAAAETVAALNRGELSDRLRAAILEKGLLLSPQTRVSTIDDASDEPAWRIEDGATHLRIEFVDGGDEATLALLETNRVSPKRTRQIQIKLKPGVDARAARKAVKDRWVRFRELYIGRQDWQLMTYVDDWIQTWEEKQATFIAAVEKEKVLVTILFGVISVVAVFLVGCVFYMIVQEKTRDIGVLKAIGASASGVASVFLVYGAAVGVVGSILGSAFGCVFVFYINEFQDLLARLHPELRVWSPQVYSFDRIPNTVKTSELVAIVIIAIVASVLGALWAARRAARIWPVEALRYE